MASRTIYVGNLPDGWREDDLRSRFGAFGTVLAATVLTDPATGVSRGFGFVEMEPAEADAAIAELDGLPIEGGLLRVNESRDRGARPPRRAY